MSLVAYSTLTPEEQKKWEEIEKKRKSYSNSWEKIEEQGFGTPKKRIPDKDTDFSNLDIKNYNWDLQLKGEPYDVLNIPGYPHRNNGNDSCLYVKKSSDELNHTNLIPYDDKWELLSWSIKIEPINSWYWKHDEVSTKSGWKGTLYKNEKQFYNCVYNSEMLAFCRLQTIKCKAVECPLDFQFRDWKEKAIGMKIWYNESPCIIKDISDYGEIRIKIIGDTVNKLIDCPNTWNDNDEHGILTTQRWYENYANGMLIDWYDDAIKWFRN